MLPSLLIQLVLRASKETDEGAHEQEEDDADRGEYLLEVGERARRVEEGGEEGLVAIVMAIE